MRSREVIPHEDLIVWEMPIEGDLYPLEGLRYVRESVVRTQALQAGRTREIIAVEQPKNQHDTKEARQNSAEPTKPDERKTDGRKGRSMDIADKQLEAMVERRAYNAEHRDDAESREELWKESVARHNARRHQESLRERLEYHERMLASHERTFAELAERHRVGKARCEELLGHA